jgi:hypothetical protein
MRSSAARQNLQGMIYGCYGLEQSESFLIPLIEPKIEEKLGRGFNLHLIRFQSGREI